MRTAQLLLFCLLVCQTTESLTDKLVNLGENVTLDCEIDVKEIYWVFQKPSDSPLLILRTFSSDSTSSHVQDQRLKDKYSSLTLSRLFIINITVHELGIYYCVKPGTTLQISNGTRLYIKDKQQEQSCEKTLELYRILTVTSILLNSVLIIAIIGLLMIKHKKPRKSRRQPQNVEPEQIEDLNTAQYSEIELPTYSRRENPIQTNGTYELLQKPELHPRSTHAEIITSYNVDNEAV
uniref:Immunoglobulin domain-containing protein n=1 Tax=Cyprinus carpio TaxID=7962 RepID=A0A8C1Z7V7_CYPCA